LPILVGLGLVVTPAPQAAAAVGTCTVNSGAAAQVTFVNNTSGPVRVNWIGYDCAEKNYATLQPGTSYVQSTFAGHLWTMRRATDNAALTDPRPALSNGLVTAVGNGVCSASTGPAVSWALKNATATALDVYWLDGQCSEVSYGAIAAGAALSLTSFVGHRWRLKVAGTEKVVGESTVLRAGTATFATAPAAVLPRSSTDRADATSASQIKVLYAVPRGGPDRRWDVNGRIGLSLSAGNRWLSDQSGGRTFRIDTSAGAPDITYVQLPRTAAAYSGTGASPRNAIESDLKAMGFAKATKKYLAFYEGPGPACGDSYWPPTLQGTTSVVYLGTCPAEGLTGDPLRFGFTEAGWVHELFHGLGAAPSCAPHHIRAGHVSDDPSDLMYAGDAPWKPALLDVGRDDYWTANPSCPGVIGSPFFQ
jgi:VHL beta domain